MELQPGTIIKTIPKRGLKEINVIVKNSTNISNTCEGCVFDCGSMCIKDITQVGFCSSITRLDSRNVIYKELKNNMDKLLSIYTVIDAGVLSKYDNSYFTASIHGVLVEGKVRVENKNIFLCQDLIGNHSGCDNRYGYKYVFAVGTGYEFEYSKEAKHVTNFILGLPESKKESFKDWHVGDVLKHNISGDTYTVIFRSGELVICKDSLGCATESYTCEELHKQGCRIQSSNCIAADSRIIEVTLDDIAEMLKVPVNLVKIKK